MSPAQSLVIAFIALILAGSGAMYLPFTTHQPISYVDALFTATASVTVVGLAVLDFEKDLTTAGQVVDGDGIGAGINFHRDRSGQVECVSGSRGCLDPPQTPAIA